MWGGSCVALGRSPRPFWERVSERSAAFILDPQGPGTKVSLPLPLPPPPFPFWEVSLTDRFQPFSTPALSTGCAARGGQASPQLGERWEGLRGTRMPWGGGSLPEPRCGSRTTSFYCALTGWCCSGVQKGHGGVQLFSTPWLPGPQQEHWMPEGFWWPGSGIV